MKGSLKELVQDQEEYNELLSIEQFQRVQEQQVLHRKAQIY